MSKENNKRPFGKYTKSRMIIYVTMFAIVYLLAFAVIHNEQPSMFLAVGIIVGMAFGSFYEQFKVLETKAEIQKQQTLAQEQPKDLIQKDVSV